MTDQSDNFKEKVAMTLSATGPTDSQSAETSSAFARVAHRQSKNKIPHINANGTITGTGNSQTLTVAIPVKELERAAPATGGARSTPAVALTIKFEHEGLEFRLHTGFMSLTAR